MWDKRLRKTIFRISLQSKALFSQIKYNNSIVSVMNACKTTEEKVLRNTRTIANKNELMHGKRN